MRALIITAIVAILVSGCAPWIGLHKIDPGMNKAEVMQHMGKPNNASGSGNEEYLWYIPYNRPWERYYVHFIDGKVTAYGKLGKQQEGQ